MDFAETDRDLTDPAWRRWTLFGLLVVLGLFYGFAYGLFFARSKNFIVAQRNQRAENYSDQHPLALPARLSFGAGAMDNARLGGGWHIPDPGGVWSSTADAWIELTLRKGDADVLLRLDTTAFLAKRHASTKLNVTLNGVQAGSWVRTVANASEPLEVRVPEALVRGRRLAVCLHTDYVGSPIRLHIGEDDRQLGLLLTSIEMQ